MRAYVVIAVAALFPFTAASQQQSTGSAASPPRIRTSNGALAGVALPSGIKVFKGIPFGGAAGARTAVATAAAATELGGWCVRPIGLQISACRRGSTVT